MSQYLPVGNFLKLCKPKNNSQTILNTNDENVTAYLLESDLEYIKKYTLKKGKFLHLTKPYSSNGISSKTTDRREIKKI